MIKRWTMLGALLLMASLPTGCVISQQDYAAALAEAEGAKAQVASLERELEKTQSELERTISDLSAAQKQAEALQGQLQATQQERDDALAQLSPLEVQVSALQAEVSSLKSQVSTLESSLAAEQAKQAAVMDQALEPPWAGGFEYVNPGSKMGQTFVPRYPILVAVEVNILTATSERGGDSLTMRVLDEAGATLASSVIELDAGHEGWLRFWLDDGGVAVPVGSKLTIRLEDTGNTVFGWKFASGDFYQPGTRIAFGAPAGGDFLFRTFGTSPRQ